MPYSMPGLGAQVGDKPGWSFWAEDLIIDSPPGGHTGSSKSPGTAWRPEINQEGPCRSPLGQQEGGPRQEQGTLSCGGTSASYHVWSTGAVSLLTCFHRLPAPRGKGSGPVEAQRLAQGASEMGTCKPLSCSSLCTAGWWETLRWVLTGPDCLANGQRLDIAPLWLP